MPVTRTDVFRFAWSHNDQETMKLRHKKMATGQRIVVPGRPVVPHVVVEPEGCTRANPNLGCKLRRFTTAEICGRGGEVPPEAITEATDTVPGAPQPSSDSWQAAWSVRETDAGRAELAHRTRVRIAIARAAGVDPLPELGRAGRAGILAGETIAESPGKPQRRCRSGTVTIRCRSGDCQKCSLPLSTHSE